MSMFGKVSKNKTFVLNNQQITVLPFLIVFATVQQRNKSTGASETSETQGTSTANKRKYKTSKQEVEKVPSSDAILSCPACMTTLCIDCQRLVTINYCHCPHIIIIKFQIQDYDTMIWYRFIKCGRLLEFFGGWGGGGRKVGGGGEWGWSRL